MEHSQALQADETLTGKWKCETQMKDMYKIYRLIIVTVVVTYTNKGITKTSQTLQLGSRFSDSDFSKPSQGRGVDSRHFIWRPWRRFYSVSHSWAKATDSSTASGTLKDQKLPATEQTKRLNTASFRTFWNCPPGRGRRLPDNLSSKSVSVHPALECPVEVDLDWMSAKDGNDAKEIVKPNQRWSRNEQRQALMQALSACDPLRNSCLNS